MTEPRPAADEAAHDRVDTDADPALPDDPETASGEPAVRSALVEALGGKRGLFDSGLPVVVFVFVHSLVAAFADQGIALRAGLAAALLAGASVVVVRLARRETLQQALSGFFALAIAVWLANRTGDARDFYLPHILYQIGYCVLFVGSVLLGRPLVGYIYAAVDGLDRSWRDDRRLRRVFAVATLGWGAVFASRALVQGGLYLADRTGWLAAARLLMGWPMTILAVAATVAWVRRGRARTWTQPEDAQPG